MKRAIVLLGLVCACVLGASSTLATTWVRSADLPQLVEESARAVMGEVISVRHALDERGLASTFVTLDVRERLYGDGPAQGAIQFKVYGAPVPLGERGMVDFVEGTPRYAIGQTVLLLMTRESEWGFSNTAGLNQGAFVIFDADGRSMAASLGGNLATLGEEGLLAWVDLSRVPFADRRHLGPTKDPVPYELLREAILNIHADQGGER